MDVSYESPGFKKLREQLQNDGHCGKCGAYHDLAKACVLPTAKDVKSRRWKPMDVAFGDTIYRPRRLILETLGRCEVCTESGGIGSHSHSELKTLNEWLTWVDKFSDDLTGRELREAKEAAKAPFTEPEEWAAFRKRYAETGDPWIKTPCPACGDVGELQCEVCHR